jgi:cytochrome c oxidase subunit I
VTTVSAPAHERVGRLDLIWEARPGVLGWLTTVDHKRIGLLYLFTTLAFFLAGGIEALLLRTQLARPDLHVVSPGTFDELFTTHGVTMIFLAVIPMQIGAFGNYLVPLMIGARDMAFPRLNALSFWLFLASGCFIYAGVFMGLAPNAGWFNYVPLGLREYSPGLNVDFYALGLIFNGVSSTAGAINLVVTIFKHRAPGMSLNRMPLFCFAILATSFSLLFALPSLTVDLVFLELQRKAGFHFFDTAHGGDPLLWQHLFWLFGHPEVYIIILPAFGIATSIIPTFARRKMLAFPLVALAELLVAFIGFGVWAHHMFAVGLPLVVVVFFAAASMMVVIPSAIQVFAWTLTVTMGRPIFKAPLLFIGAFIVFFVIGGLSGITFAAIPIDQATTDTYYVVAHFHFIIFGAAVFPLLGGMFYWFPKVTGRMYHERFAQVAFWLTFVGTAVTFFPMHIVGLLGMTRRIYTYAPDTGWASYNLIETIGGFVLASGLVLIAVNLAWSRVRGAPAGSDPFNGGTLEWVTASPPPHYNFAVIPRVTSPYPNWDALDRVQDARNLERGARVYAEDHETVASTVRDGYLDDVLGMPSESPWPIVLAACLTALFALVLTSHYLAATAFAGLAALALGAWHWQEPE